MVSLILFCTPDVKTWEIHARIHFKSFMIFAYRNSLVNAKKEKKKTKQTQIFQTDSGNRWRLFCKTCTNFYWSNQINQGCREESLRDMFQSTSTVEH